MKKPRRVLVILVSLIIIADVASFCIERINRYKYKDKKISFYIVKQENRRKGIVKENGELLFTDDDILNYNKKSHEITFKREFLGEYADVEDDFGFYSGSKLLGGKALDRFVVYIDDEKIYEGYFSPPLHKNFILGGPSIIDTKNGIYILPSVESEFKIIINKELFKVLRSKKKLHSYYIDKQ